MRSDPTEIVSVEQALSEMEVRWKAAEEHAQRAGKQMGWMLKETTMSVDDMTPHTLAFRRYIQQFGPWMQKHLEGIFRVACFTHSVS